MTIEINMKIWQTLLIVFVMMISAPMWAQDTTKALKPEKDRRPVRSPWESHIILNNQTTVVPQAKTLEFIIQHRFGKLNSGTFDLFGLYAPSNIRMGLNYSIFNNLSVGLGTTKNNMLQDLNWKWAILKQTRSGSMPLAITYYGNANYDARDKANFGTEYKPTHKVSYFHQIIIGRKFHRLLSLQISANYSHFNQIDTTVYPEAVHDNISLSVNGRVKIIDAIGINFEYDQPLTTPAQIKPNIGFGVEFSTSSHVFQIFVASYDAIMPQRNQANNINDFAKGDILIGFNITRLWNF